MLSISESLPPHFTKTLIFGHARRLVGILVPWPGIEPGPLAVKTQSPNHWTTSSVQFSCSVVSSSLRPHGLQHARPLCPSPTPRVYPYSCPLSQWCHPTISSSVIPFSSHPQSFPASGSFQVSQLFASGGQSTGVSALASFLPKKSQGWSPSELTEHIPWRNCN